MSRLRRLSRPKTERFGGESPRSWRLFELRKVLKGGEMEPSRVVTKAKPAEVGLLQGDTVFEEISREALSSQDACF